MLKLSVPRWYEEYEKGNLSEKEKTQIDTSVHDMGILKKYFNQPETYITFSDVLRFGFNPLYGHKTPFGIYAYPFNTIWLEDPPEFASNRKYIHIFKNLGKTLNLSDYSNEDLKDDLNQLNSLYKIARFNKLALFAAKNNKKPGAILWNFTKLLSNSNNRNEIDVRNFSDDFNVNEWSKVFDNLGYTCIVDSGDSIIHESEPIQALFIISSSKKIEYLDTVNNIIGKFLPKMQVELNEVEGLDPDNENMRQKIIQLALQKNKSAIKKLDSSYNDMIPVIIQLSKIENPIAIKKLNPDYNTMRSLIIDLAKKGNESALEKLEPYYPDMRQVMIDLAKRGNDQLFYIFDLNYYDMRKTIIEFAKRKNTYAIDMLRSYFSVHSYKILDLAKNGNQEAKDIINLLEPSVKLAYFQGGGGVNEPTPKKKKYKSDRAIVVTPRFKEPLYKSYDYVEAPGVDGPAKHGPGAGYTSMQNYKSISDFLKARRKKLKNKYKADDSYIENDGSITKHNSNLLQSLIKCSVLRKVWKPEDGLTGKMKEFVKNKTIEIFNNTRLFLEKIDDEFYIKEFVKSNFRSMELKLADNFNLNFNIVSDASKFHNEVLSVMFSTAQKLFATHSYKLKMKQFYLPRKWKDFIYQEINRILDLELSAKTEFTGYDLEEFSTYLYKPITIFTNTELVIDNMIKEFGISDSDAIELFNSGIIHAEVKKNIDEYIKNKLRIDRYEKRNARMNKLQSIIKSAIDFPSDNINSTPMLSDSGVVSDSVYLGGLSDQYLQKPDFEGKLPTELNVGRDYTDYTSLDKIQYLQNLLDDLINKHLSPKEPDLFGLPSGTTSPEGLDKPSDEPPYYGTTDSGNTVYDNVWFK